jgi:hypothetical protein
MENMLQSNLTPIFGNQQFFEIYPLLLFLSLVWDFLFFLFMFIINPCVCTFIVMFRLFLIIDLKNGVILRSMRNRVIEICLLSPRIDVLYDVTLLLQNREDWLVYCSFTRSCDNKLVTWLELSDMISSDYYNHWFILSYFLFDWRREIDSKNDFVLSTSSSWAF